MKNSQGSEPIWVCAPNPEPYLLSRSKPQEPRREHILIFLTTVTGDISNSQDLVCGQNLDGITAFILLSQTLALISTSCRTSLALSPRIMLWFRTGFHIGEKSTSYLEQKKAIIFFLFLILQEGGGGVVVWLVCLFICGFSVVDVLGF